MVKVLGCDVNVVESGVGQPIIFLHGNPDSSQLWAPIAASLATSHRCIVPDLPGYGRSSIAPDFDFSLNGLAEFMGLFTRRCDLKSPFTSSAMTSVGSLVQPGWRHIQTECAVSRSAMPPSAQRIGGTTGHAFGVRH